MTSNFRDQLPADPCWPFHEALGQRILEPASIRVHRDRTPNNFRLEAKETSAGWRFDELDSEFSVGKLTENSEEALEFMLKHHDWYYEFADDHRAWKKGDKELKSIGVLMKKIGEPKATELFNKYKLKS